MNLENQIKEVLLLEATIKEWKNDFNSDAYKKASALNLLLFGKPLNKQRNCGCVQDLFDLIKHRYSKKENINQKKKQMENKFRLKGDLLVQNHALGTPVNNNNLTDEIAIKLLQINKNNINLFEKYPQDWAKLVGGKPSEKKEVEEKPKTDGKLVNLRAIADEIAEAKGLKKPHWNSSNKKLKEFINANK